MSSHPGPCEYEVIGKLGGQRLCEECGNEYAMWSVKMGLVLRALCDSCLTSFGGAHYVQSKGVTDWQGPAGPSEGRETEDEQVGYQVDYSIRSEQEFPTRAREYLDVLNVLKEELEMAHYDVMDMYRCFYKVQGHACRCENDHHTVEFRRDKNERSCPRCNRAYRFRMADEMTSLAADFGCHFLMRYVFTVPEEERDIPLPELLAKVYRTMISFFSDADILGYWAIPHEFSSRSPTVRNPHVEVFMLPIGLKRRWVNQYNTGIDGTRVLIRRLHCVACEHRWEKPVKLLQDVERCPACKSKDTRRIRKVQITEVLHYQKWMLIDEEVEETRRELLRARGRYSLEKDTMRYIPKAMLESYIRKLTVKLRESKRLEDLRRLWRNQEFPETETETNVHYSYVTLEKAARHTIPYALRPPFNPEYVLVYNDQEDTVTYQLDEKRKDTIMLTMEDVVTLFRYDYYNRATHRIHRLGFLSNAVWRQYYRALTGKEPPEEEGDEVLACASCDGKIVEVWHNDHTWFDWLRDEFLDDDIVVHTLYGQDGADFYAWVKRNLPETRPAKRYTFL